MLARIIANSTEHSQELERELRRRGYETEIVQPGGAPRTAAGLVIDLQEVTPEEAFHKVETIAVSDNLAVLIAPHALDEKPLGAAETIATSEPNYETTAPALAHADASPSMAAFSPPPESQQPVGELEALLPALPGSEADNAALEATWPDEPFSDWPIWQAPNEEPPSSGQGVGAFNGNLTPPRSRSHAVCGLPAPAVVVRSRVSFWHSLRHQLPSNEKVFWRAAISTALMAVVSLLGVALFHRFSPLPAQVSPQTAATRPALPGGVSAVPLAEPRSSAEPADLLQPAAIQAASNYAAEADVVAPDTVVPADVPANHPARRGSRRRWQPGADSLAQDTVVHFDRTPAAAPASGATQPEIKRYSDLK